MTREGMPVAVRHVESIIRMSEARASMRLSEHVDSEDIDAAIAVMLSSFIGTQKLSVQKSLQKKFARYTHFHRDYDQLLLEILRGIVREMNYWDRVGAPGERVAAQRADDGALQDAREQGFGVRHQRLGSFLRVHRVCVGEVHARPRAGHDLPRAAVIETRATEGGAEDSMSNPR